MRFFGYPHDSSKQPRIWIGTKTLLFRKTGNRDKEKTQGSGRKAQVINLKKWGEVRGNSS